MDQHTLSRNGERKRPGAGSMCSCTSDRGLKKGEKKIFRGGDLGFLHLLLHAHAVPVCFEEHRDEKGKVLGLRYIYYI